MLEDLLDVESVAKALRQEPKLIRVWIRRRKIKATKVGRMWFVSLEELERVKGQELDRRQKEALDSRWKE